MCFRLPRTMRTWERTPLACLFSTDQRAGQRPALPGVLSQELFMALGDAQKR
jgi:hypothetical protein